MEQIYKRTIPSRQTDQLTEHQRRVLAHSNAISTTTGKLSELSKDERKQLGLGKQKALDC